MLLVEVSFGIYDISSLEKKTLGTDRCINRKLAFFLK